MTADKKSKGRRPAGNQCLVAIGRIIIASGLPWRVCLTADRKAVHTVTSMIVCGTQRSHDGVPASGARDRDEKASLGVDLCQVNVTDIPRCGLDVESHLYTSALREHLHRRTDTLYWCCMSIHFKWFHVQRPRAHPSWQRSVDTAGHLSL